MEKSRLRSQPVEYITWDNFIKHIEATTPVPHWHGTIEGIPFTHENDSRYLILAQHHVNFNRGEVLCILDNGTAFTIPGGAIGDLTE